MDNAPLLNRISYSPHILGLPEFRFMRLRRRGLCVLAASYLGTLDNRDVERYPECLFI